MILVLHNSSLKPMLAVSLHPKNNNNMFYNVLVNYIIFKNAWNTRSMIWYPDIMIKCIHSVRLLLLCVAMHTSIKWKLLVMAQSTSRYGLVVSVAESFCMTSFSKGWLVVSLFDDTSSRLMVFSYLYAASVNSSSAPICLSPPRKKYKANLLNYKNSGK